MLPSASYLFEHKPVLSIKDLSVVLTFLGISNAILPLLTNFQGP